jgi:hypothetical protein
LVVAVVACSVAVRDVLSPRFRFDRQYVDVEYGGNGRPGWIRAGDMDNDGDVDLVAGGGYALYVYENSGDERRWLRHGSLDGTGLIGANGAVLYDADGDGDLDVISAQYKMSLGWWENPGGALTDGQWAFHVLAEGSDFFAHDVVLSDLDGDGRREEFIYGLHRKPRVRLEWFRPEGDATQPWARSVIEPGRGEGDIHYAGIDVGDLDADGDADVAFSNGWYESSGDPSDPWEWHEVTGIRGISNTLVRDVDSDGQLDLILSAGHFGKGIYWFEAPDGLIGPWRMHEIDREIVNPECLQAADLDRDGDLDLVTCDLDFDRWDQEVHRIYVLERQEGEIRWKRHVVSPGSYPSHILQIFDVNRDGWPDVISEATGYKVISYYERVQPEAVPGQ